MNIIKVKHTGEVPFNFTGIAEFTDGTKIWYKEGDYHREDGPAVVENSHRHWYLDGNKIFCSCDLGSIFCFKNKVVLSKETHELYPKIQKWKVLSKDEIYEVLTFPGLEGYILE